MKHIFQLRLAAALVLGLTPLLHSCDVDDLTKSLTEGTTETYRITNKNSGTLSINEPYADAVASFIIADHPQISSIEFTADGWCHIVEKQSNDVYYTPQRSMEFDVEGRKVSVTMPATQTRASEWYKYSAETYSYTYDRESNSFVVSELGFVVCDGELIVYENNEDVARYTATPEKPIESTALTDRLCHTWGLSNVLLKIYRTDKGEPKLVFTYKLSDEDRYEFCVDQFVFTHFGHFHRYMHDSNNGNGDWRWIDEANQRLHYDFTYFADYNPVPVVGSNDLTVYFADNRLYMTEECEALASDYTDDDEFKDVTLKAVLLYQLEAQATKQ